ncbi:MAG: VCBS repeat-containing protein [Candidatus Marinimicrobia bacterium]|nr:VCBS repeat-containing protein [Candidatus Neomarinimicrobiota bacterium]
MMATAELKFVTAVIGFLLLAGNCAKNREIDPETAGRMVVHRNLGLAYLEENLLQEAEGEFQLLVDLASREPLGYANIGLARMRREDYGRAEAPLKQALKLEPAHPAASMLLATLYDRTDRQSTAVRLLERVLKKHPRHVQSLYRLSQYFKQDQTAGSRLKAETYLYEVVNARPANIAARFQLVELLIQNEKPDEALEHLEAINQVLPGLPGGSLALFERSLNLMRSGHVDAASEPVMMFHNLLRGTPIYRGALKVLSGTVGSIIGPPVYRFSHHVQMPSRLHSGVPEAVKFTKVTHSGLELAPMAPANAGDDAPRVVMALGDYDGDGDQDVYVSRWRSGSQASRQYLFTNRDGAFTDVAVPAGLAHAGRDLTALFADYDNDGNPDLFVGNSVADRLYRNRGDGTFEDVTVAAGLEASINSRAVLFADFDLEGDLDIFLAAASGKRMHRNNSDGTFSEVEQEVGIALAGVVINAIGWGDFDDDGDIDLILVNETAGIKYYDNLRQNYYRDLTAQVGLDGVGPATALAVGDYNNDGLLDLYVPGRAGGQQALFRNRGDGTFERDTSSEAAFKGSDLHQVLDAIFFDADNDGYLDLLVAGAAKDAAGSRSVWLFYNGGDGIFQDASTLLPDNLGPVSKLAVADYDGDGDLDIFLAGDAAVHLLRNDGGNLNPHLVVRLAALRTGSSKNNHFGIGAKLEVNAGTLYQMRVMTTPVAHFGLGAHANAEVVRVIWTNGVRQNSFNPGQNQTIMETQILKGSCPFLFVWNGKEYEFVTDVLWASAIGMPLGIMSGEPLYAFPNSTDEYIFLPGARLQPTNGQYSLQFTTELWETAYLDQVKLLVADHPDSVNMTIDGKFTPPPFPPFRLYAFAEKRAPLSAVDGRGNDLLPAIIQHDGQYVRNLTPDRYQGIVKPHDLILDLGDLSQSDSIFLFLHGWVFPTDASINVNIAQAGAAQQIAPSLQVVDARGEWKTLIPNLGFPKGKHKTLVVDLSNKFPAGDYRIRIRTNMQIYWDHIYYTTAMNAGPIRTTLLDPVAAELHYRGFSEVTQTTRYSPHTPDYLTVSTEPRWRDLTGRYTRYGDVLPLLGASDSKFVIMNAGDELTLGFDATGLPALPSGWTRDFIFYNDGWLKDGDLNTAHGQTVEPLPFHGMSSYPYGRFDSYPDDEDHIAYRQTYNTRLVTTEAFRRYRATRQGKGTQ